MPRSTAHERGTEVCFDKVIEPRHHIKATTSARITMIINLSVLSVPHLIIIHLSLADYRLRNTVVWVVFCPHVLQDPNFICISTGLASRKQICRPQMKSSSELRARACSILDHKLISKLCLVIKQPLFCVHIPLTSRLSGSIQQSNSSFGVYSAYKSYSRDPLYWREYPSRPYYSFDTFGGFRLFYCRSIASGYPPVMARHFLLAQV